MNIRLIKTKKNIINVYPVGDRIMELSYRKVGDSVFYGLSLYDPDKNTIQEIVSNIHEDCWIPIQNCIWESGDHYYAIYDGKEDNGSITVYKYCTADGSVKVFYSIPDKFPMPSEDSQIRLFVITEDQIIIQTELKRAKKTEKLMGNIEFFQVLCNVTTGERTEVKDLNLINNGINTIIPVSSTDIMLKTGFSHLEDQRIEQDSEAEALIESVYFGSLSMFISSFRDKTTIGYKLLGTAYFNKCIVSPGAQDDYIYFTVIDPGDKSSETVFYDHVNDETFRCLQEDVDKDNLSRAYVIGNVPYMRSSSPELNVFFNVKTKENEGIFYDEQFAAVVGKLLVFTSTKHNRRSTRLYLLQGSRHVLEEHGRYLNGCCINDDHYIYIFKR